MYVNVAAAFSPSSPYCHSEHATKCPPQIVKADAAAISAVHPIH